MSSLQVRSHAGVDYTGAFSLEAHHLGQPQAGMPHTPASLYPVSPPGCDPCRLVRNRGGRSLLHLRDPAPFHALPLQDWVPVTGAPSVRPRPPLAPPSHLGSGAQAGSALPSQVSD